MSTVVLQSCDDAYASFLEVTGPVNAAYSAWHGYSYRQFVGLKSPRAGGNFNRYHLIREEIARGKHDWALWIDADALVIDLNLPLEPIIERTPDKLIIACRGTLEGDWDINNGVFLIQLRHPLAGPLVDHMIREGDRLGRRTQGFHSDQYIMHEWLRARDDEAGCVPIVQCYTGKDYDLFNYDGTFLQHVLREFGPDAERLARLRGLASVAFDSLPPDSGGIGRDAKSFPAGDSVKSFGI